jgi:hypothetical protein
MYFIRPFQTLEPSDLEINWSTLSLKVYLPTKKSKDADKNMASIWMTRPQAVYRGEGATVSTAATQHRSTWTHAIHAIALKRRIGPSAYELT